MYAVFLAFFIAVVTVVAAVAVEQRRLRCATRIRTPVAAALLACSTWLASVIALSVWLEVPGAQGPVQFWGGAADAFQDVRFAALVLLAVGAMPLAGATAVLLVVAPFQNTEGPAGLRCVLPALALGMFLLAHTLFLHYRFYPTA